VQGALCWGKDSGIPLLLGFKPLALVMKKKKICISRHVVQASTASLLQAPQFMDGVSPLLPSPCPLPLVDQTQRTDGKPADAGLASWLMES